MTSAKIVTYLDFWQKWYGEEFSDTFERIFEGIRTKKPISLYSMFGNTPPSPHTINICFSGEKHDRTNEPFDVHLIHKPTDIEKGIVLFPYFTYYPTKHDFWPLLQIPRVFPFNKDRFCLFVVSNAHFPYHVRNVFMQILSNMYKKVDSAGLAYNNTGFQAPGFQGEYNPDYYALISRYRFMICFENANQDYYCTEKLYNAYMGGAIPIYWGTNRVLQWFNPKSFLYLEDNSVEAMERLVQKIKEIDEDPAKYEEMYKQPLLRDGKIPEEMDPSRIKEHVREVLRRKNLLDE